MIPPISPDLLVKARGGCPAAKADLWCCLRPLVGMVARRYHRIEREDAEGEAAVVYLEALRVWDPERGVPFAAYFARKLHHRLWTLVRRSSREHGRRAYLGGDRTAEETGDPLGLFGDPRWSEPFEEAEIRLVLEELGTRERRILAGALRGIPLAALAREEGVTRQTVTFHLKKALKKLRREWYS
ncbi:MAG: sigma-70 family RNA polymerase sigma factor [Kyrpidia sp.]|nr:sigma-70 family RNA polymerase sigma factor [Kyrpidia sp.]